MTTYQVQINEQTPLGKSIVSLLKSANGAVVSVTKKRELHSPNIYIYSE